MGCHGSSLTFALSDFFGLAAFSHPSPAPLKELNQHFPSILDPEYTPVLVPHVKGESIDSLHDRIAYTLNRIIGACDKDLSGPKTLLICTHAASMICMGRILTGKMPDDPCQEDFQCFTCALSVFKRRGPGTNNSERTQRWDSSKPNEIPIVEWRGGQGLLGGWDCTANGDCTFLSGGAERGW
jgi:transcription factor C subunit 7